jgi:hypothetical protein
MEQERMIEIRRDIPFRRIVGRVGCAVWLLRNDYLGNALGRHVQPEMKNSAGQMIKKL